MRVAFFDLPLRPLIFHERSVARVDSRGLVPAVPAQLDAPTLFGMENGFGLGPVRSRIVVEVCIGLLKADESPYLVTRPKGGLKLW